MMEKPFVSVIVPTKNSARTLEACLRSVKNQTYPNIEIIVVDNMSTDTTREIASSFTKQVFLHGPERSAQRNFGVAHAQGKYVVIIDSDMVVTPYVIEKCVVVLDASPALQGVVIPEVSFGEGFRAQCKRLERSFYVGVDRMEAARCFRKSVYLEMGGYDEMNIGTEDYDLPQRMQQHYGKKCIGRIEDAILHDEGRLSLWRTCQKKFYYGQRLHSYIKKEANQEKFAHQASVLQRYGLFIRSPKKLLEKPILGVGMLFMKTVEMMSGACGYLVGKWKKIENIYS